MFNQREVNQIFGHIPSRTLREWALCGFYQWSGESEDARGIHRRFSLLNVYQIGICEVLARANIQSNRIKSIMTHFFVGGRFQKEKFALVRMNGFLVIAESLEGKSKRLFSGTFSKAELIEKLNSELSTFIVRTIIDLEAIKKRVDFLISQVK